MRCEGLGWMSWGVENGISKNGEYVRTGEIDLGDWGVFVEARIVWNRVERGLLAKVRKFDLGTVWYKSESKRLSRVCEMRQHG